jgi:hypothetical protein
MDFILTNWWLIIVVIALIAMASYAIFVFVKMPTNAQLASVREWLLFAVAQAEKELGSGTGQLKLRYVYDMFILRFTNISKVISFEAFSQLVDEALYTFRNMLKDNKAVIDYVGAAPEAAEKLELGINLDEEGEDING